MPRSKYRKLQNKIKKQKINIIFNRSKIELTPEMEKVLNRGLNFCVLPLKLDLTQVLVDFKQFERTISWQEFWHNSCWIFFGILAGFLKQFMERFMV